MRRRLSLPPSVIDAAIQGEEAAWEELYCLLRPFILGLCVKKHELILEDAQDVCQTVILRFSRSLAFIEDPGAWICAVVRRHIVSQKKRPQAPSPINNRQDAMMIDDILAIWQAFRKLGSKCQLIIRLIFVEGYTQRETANQIDLPEGSMQHLKKQCVEEFGLLYLGGCNEL